MGNWKQFDITLAITSLMLVSSSVVVLLRISLHGQQCQTPVTGLRRRHERCRRHGSDWHWSKSSTARQRICKDLAWGSHKMSSMNLGHTLCALLKISLSLPWVLLWTRQRSPWYPQREKGCWQESAKCPWGAGGKPKGRASTLQDQRSSEGLGWQGPLQVSSPSPARSRVTRAALQRKSWKKASAGKARRILELEELMWAHTR